MPQREPGHPGKMQSVRAGICFLLAVYLFGQLLGLILIQQIAERVAHTNRKVAVPVSVRLVGFAADKLHNDVLKVPLSPDGSNWPVGFRLFFVLEMSGLAGLCLGLTQLGVGILKYRQDWTGQAKKVLHFSGLALLTGFLFLKMIDL
jgi:uncharacterized membrane protein